MIPGVAALQDFLKMFLEGEFGVKSDSWKFRLRIDFESLTIGSEFLAREDLENMITLLFIRIEFFLHLAHNFANFRVPYTNVLLQIVRFY